MSKITSLLLCLLLAGCLRLNLPPLPELFPGRGATSPTPAPTAAQTAALPQAAPVVAATSAAPSLTPPASPTALLSPTSTAPLPETPTLEPSPTIDRDQRIELRIVQPGPMSRVVSPIQLIAHIDPAFTGLTRLELIGEDGRELYRKVFITYSNIGYYTRVEEKISFEFKGAAQMARLQISTYDKAGNLLALNSVRLMLFSVGENQLGQPYPAQERVVLRAPASEAEISGGVLLVQGEVDLMNDTPLILELFDTEGRIVGSRLVQLPAGGGKYQPFSADLPYQVSGRLAARLNIRQLDDRISGLAYLYSRPLYLNP
jgi:hypothetical protein